MNGFTTLAELEKESVARMKRGKKGCEKTAIKKEVVYEWESFVVIH